MASSNENTQGGAVDILFDVRNSYHLGAYQQCINEAQNVKTRSAEQSSLRDSYLYRAYIALGKPSVPLGEIQLNDDTPLALRAVRRFAEYQVSGFGAAKRRVIVEELDKELDNPSHIDYDSEEGCAHILMAALLLMHEDREDDALKVLSRTGGSENGGASWLECRSATVQCLLKIQRTDLAIKELKKMQEVDEDNTITQLAFAWVNMAAGKEKLRDAFYIYQEMVDKYGATTLLLVSQAACLIMQQKYEEAERLLHDAQQRDMNNPELLVNLISIGQLLGKPTEVTNRYVNQLKQDHPNHVWTRDYLQKEKAFDRLCKERA